MGHGAHLSVWIFHHLDVACSQGREERRPVALDPEQDEVGPHAARVEAPVAGLRRPARRNDAVHLREGLGQPSGVGVVLCEALDHAVWSVRQRDDAGGCEDPGLAHPATDHLACPPRSPDHVAPPDDDRPDRAGQALREAERHGVGRVRQLGRTDALGHDRVPEPGAIDMERHLVGARDRGDLAGVLGGQRLAHRMGVGVLDRDQAGDRLVRVARVAEGRLDLGGVHRAIGTVLAGRGCSRRR